MFGFFKKEDFASVPKEARQILKVAFPGGEKQLDAEAKGLFEEFPTLFTLQSSRSLVVWAKTMWITNTDKSKSFEDMCAAINRHEKNRLTDDESVAVYSWILEQDFATRKGGF